MRKSHLAQRWAVRWAKRMLASVDDSPIVRSRAANRAKPTPARARRAGSKRNRLPHPAQLTFVGYGVGATVGAGVAVGEPLAEASGATWRTYAPSTCPERSSRP